MQANSNEPPQHYWLMLILQSTNNPECFTCDAVKPDFIYSVLAQLALGIRVKDVLFFPIGLHLIRMSSSFQPIEVPSDLTLSFNITVTLFSFKSDV